MKDTPITFAHTPTQGEIEAFAEADIDAQIAARAESSEMNTSQSESGPVWPTNEDGTPKSMGELTHEQQQEQFHAAMRRLKKEFAPLGIDLVDGNLS